MITVELRLNGTAELILRPGKQVDEQMLAGCFGPRSGEPRAFTVRLRQDGALVVSTPVEVAP